MLPLLSALPMHTHEGAAAAILNFPHTPNERNWQWRIFFPFLFTRVFFCTFKRRAKYAEGETRRKNITHMAFSKFDSKV